MANTVSKIISDATLNKIITIESSGNPSIKAPTSSATGLFQFIDGTWLSVIRKYRPDLCAGRSYGDILALRKNPVICIEIGARFTEENARALGSGYSDGDLYLAHFLGVGAARNLLRASPSAQVGSLVGSSAVNANRSILAGKTAGQVRAWAADKMANARGEWIARYYQTAPAATPAPVDDHPMSGRYSAICESVQRRLAAMGYLPGFFDGKWGGATRGAIAAFQNDRGLAGSMPEINGALFDALTAAEHEGFQRPIARERAEATPNDLNEVLPEVKAAQNSSFWAKAQGWFAGIFGTASASTIVSSAIDAKQQVGDVQAWFGSTTSIVVGVLGLIAIVVITIVLTRKAAGSANDAADAATAAFNVGARR